MKDFAGQPGEKDVADSEEMQAEGYGVKKQDMDPLV